MDSAGTCVKTERYRADLAVTSVTRKIAWQYPSIVSGTLPMGESSCASAKDTCFKYPVKFRSDGEPVASFGAWLARGTYNLSFDTWFNWQAAGWNHQTSRNNTEIMIWLAHPHIYDARHFLAVYRIDGIKFGMMSWMAPKDTHGRYVAFVALNAPARGRHAWKGLWFNPFWRHVERRGWLKPGEYLHSIDLGFELVSGGVGNNIHQYTLQHVR